MFICERVPNSVKQNLDICSAFASTAWRCSSTSHAGIGFDKKHDVKLQTGETSLSMGKKLKINETQEFDCHQFLVQHDLVVSLN